MCFPLPKRSVRWTKKRRRKRIAIAMTPTWYRCEEMPFALTRSKPMNKLATTTKAQPEGEKKEEEYTQHNEKRKKCPVQIRDGKEDI